MIEQYEHYGKKVFVQQDLKGKHRDYCLCFKCKKLDVEDIDKNCPIAKKIFSICIDEHLVLVIWECPQFDEEGK